METILLFVIIGLIFYIKKSIGNEVTKLNGTIKDLRNTIKELQLKINLLSQRNNKTNLEQEVLKETIQPKREVVKPTPKVPEIVKETPVDEPILAAEANHLQPKKVEVTTEEVKLTPKAHKAYIPKKEKVVTPSLWERFKEKNPDLEKFIGENIINKIGILILVLGISYFVKYAIDKNWINEPARVGIGILAGSLVLGVAHKLHKKYAAFGSVLVAGAIAIFYFTIAIAFHEYHLFSQTIAFVIMVVITAFSCLISLSYNRMELAILSLIGGFAVPFMVSTGSGNYVVLFTYIAILDIGILAIAYFKKWNLLNVLAFVFTTLLFAGWVSNDLFYEEQPHYVGALAFGFLFYILFIITNIINNIRTKGTFSKIQLVILSVNTMVFYAVGMLVLSKFHPEYAGLFTACLGLLNLVYALVLYKKFGLDKTAIYLLIGLTLTFITLAIPIQFEGNNITLFWAAEAVLLLWLAQKSKIKSYRFGSVIVHTLMLVSLFMDWAKFYINNEALHIILNPIFSTGLFAVLSVVGVVYLLRKETDVVQLFAFKFNPIKYRKVLVYIALVLGYFVGLFEILYQSDLNLGTQPHTLLSLPVLYHLLFSAILCFILYKNKTSANIKMVQLIALVNIVAFAFLFSKLPFIELEENLSLGEASKIAYYTHFILLLLVVYFGYLLFDIYKKTDKHSFVNKRLFIYGGAFLIVFISSIELILEGLKISDITVDSKLLAAINPNNEVSNTDALRYLIKESITAAKHKIIKTGLPVLWGVLAFVFLLLGIKKQIKELRIIALTLLGITIVKLFAYDISNASETGKIIAFILLGVLILIISFLYQKIKVFVIDETKTDETRSDKTDKTDENDEMD